MHKAFYQQGRHYETLTWLGEGNALVHTTREISFDERQERAEEEAANKAFSKALKKLSLYNQSLGIGREIASTGIFRVTNKGERQPDVKLKARTARGTVFEYEGPELRQDDERVLEFIIRRAWDQRKSKSGSRCLDLNLLDFATEMGWERRHEKALHVAACLKRLQKGIVQLGEEGSRVSFQFVSKTTEVGKYDLLVVLHEEALQMFKGGCTYRTIEERKQLPDGIPSWLGGFLRANDDEDVFTIEDLHMHSGSRSNVYKFRENLADAVKHLKATGVVQDVTFSYGKMRVHRH